jgi:hypothetical protein
VHVHLQAGLGGEGWGGLCAWARGCVDLWQCEWPRVRRCAALEKLSRPCAPGQHPHLHSFCLRSLYKHADAPLTNPNPYQTPNHPKPSYPILNPTKPQTPYPDTRHPPQSDACYISSDGGRVCRPLIICDAGVPRVRAEHIERLKAGEWGFQDFLARGGRRL